MNLSFCLSRGALSYWAGCKRHLVLAHQQSPSAKTFTKIPCVDFQPCSSGGWQLLSLKLGDQSFLHRSLWQLDFKATFWHPNGHWECRECDPCMLHPCPRVGCHSSAWWAAGEDGTSWPSWTVWTLLPSGLTHLSPLPTTTVCLLLPCSPLHSTWQVFLYPR